MSTERTIHIDAGPDEIEPLRLLLVALPNIRVSERKRWFSGGVRFSVSGQPDVIEDVSRRATEISRVAWVDRQW